MWCLLVTTVLTAGTFLLCLVLSLVDVDRFNFALYFLLLSFMALFVLTAFWVSKPSFVVSSSNFGVFSSPQLHIPECFGAFWRRLKAIRWRMPFRRPNRYSDPSSAEGCFRSPASPVIDPQSAQRLIETLKGIPTLVNAIQYSMEANYYSDAMRQCGHPSARIPTMIACPFGNESTRNSSNFSADDEASVAASLKNAEEDWIPYRPNAVWTNPHLHLEVIPRKGSYPVVFPLSETRVESPVRLRKISRSMDTGLCELATAECEERIAAQTQEPSKNSLFCASDSMPSARNISDKGVTTQMYLVSEKSSSNGSQIEVNNEMNDRQSDDETVIIATERFYTHGTPKHTADGRCSFFDTNLLKQKLSLDSCAVIGNDNKVECVTVNDALVGRLHQLKASKV